MTTQAIHSAAQTKADTTGVTLQRPSQQLATHDSSISPLTSTPLLMRQHFDPTSTTRQNLKLDPERPDKFLQELKDFMDESVRQTEKRAGRTDPGHVEKVESALRQVKNAEREGKISKSIARSARNIVSKRGGPRMAEVLRKTRFQKIVARRLARLATSKAAKRTASLIPLVGWGFSADDAWAGAKDIAHGHTGRGLAGMACAAADVASDVLHTGDAVSGVGGTALSLGIQAGTVSCQVGLEVQRAKEKIDRLEDIVHQGGELPSDAVLRDEYELDDESILDFKEQIQEHKEDNQEPSEPENEEASAPFLQAKLTVNTPGDKYEQEADRVAERVMRMPEPNVQRQCACGQTSTKGECSECKKKKEANRSLQRVASSPVGGIAAPPIVNDVLSSPGSPLPTTTRSFMESRFGQDFSQVRVHTDTQAQTSAKAVSARAYTVGQHIVFGHGQFQIDSLSGQRLLAHELTHTLQQGKVLPDSGDRLMRQPLDSEPAHTTPRRVNIPFGAKSSIEFHTQTATLGSLDVRATGRLAITGNASLIGEELPKKNSSEALQTRVRELFTETLNAARPTGTGLEVEVPVSGEVLKLKLVTGAERSPAFQVSGRFKARGRELKVTGCEVKETTLQLDATIWVAPSSQPSTPNHSQADIAMNAGDGSVEQFSFAGDLAQFSDKSGKGPERSGGVTLKTAMDAFEANVPDFVKNNSMLRLPEQRAAFFQAMRAYFGTDEKTVEHFSKLRKANVKGATTWLHENAAARLEKVQAEIGAEHMPVSGGVGWPRSESTLASRQSIGNLHNLGYAVDYNAFQAPHIKDQRILDLVKIVTGRSPTAQYGSPEGMKTRDIGQTFTTGTPDEQRTLAADQRLQKWLEHVEREAASVGQASEDFRASLQTTQDDTSIDLAPQLLELRTTWFAAKTDAEKQEVILKLPSVTKPWLDKVAARKPTLEAEIAARGMDLATLPSGKDLSDAIGALDDVNREFKSILDKSGTEITAKLRARIDKTVAKSRTLLKDVPDIPGDDALAELNWWSGFVKARRLGLIAKTQLDKINGLHAAISNDPAFVFGNSQKTVSDPGLAQLLDTGFFSLSGQRKAGKEAFNVDFVKSMVKHGFTHGATWDTPDFMHFELRWNGPA